MLIKRIALLLALLLVLTGCSGGGGEQTQASATAASSTPRIFTAMSTTATRPVKPSTAATTTATTAADPVDPVLAQLQDALHEDGALLGTAYLGYAELPGWEDVCVYVEAGGFGEVYPFLLTVDEAHAVLQEGGEVYAVIPADDSVQLTVSEFLMSDEPTRGRDLLTLRDGQPLLLRGNVSEIVPNLLITATDGDTTLEYSPCLSGMDGSLVVTDGVLDFTPYELLLWDYPGYDPLPDAVFTGTWYGRHESGGGELLAQTLTLDPDGTAEYLWGLPDGPAAESYAGFWYESHDDTGSRLMLELYGGPADGDEQMLLCTFRWDLQSSALLLTHEEGDTLLHGTEGDTFSLLCFDGHHLVGTWSSPCDYHNWYYELQLYDNGECRFALGETDVGELAVYDGWWYLEEALLSLSLMLTGGEHPESPELDFLYGDYEVESLDAYRIRLVYRTGDILTLEMEESTAATFTSL